MISTTTLVLFSCLFTATFGWVPQLHRSTTTRLPFVPEGTVPDEMIGQPEDPAAVIQEDGIVGEQEDRHKISYHMMGSWNKARQDPVAVMDDEEECEHSYFDRSTGDALCWGLFDDDDDEPDAQALQDALDSLQEVPKKVWDREISTEKFKPEDNHISYGMMGSWNKPPETAKANKVAAVVEEEEECEHPYFDQMTGDSLCWFI